MRCLDDYKNELAKEMGQELLPLLRPLIEGSVRRAITDAAPQFGRMSSSGSIGGGPKKAKGRVSEDCRDPMRCSFAPECVVDAEGQPRSTMPDIPDESNGAEEANAPPFVRSSSGGSQQQGAAGNRSPASARPKPGSAVLVAAQATPGTPAPERPSLTRSQSEGEKPKRSSRPDGGRGSVTFGDDVKRAKMVSAVQQNMEDNQVQNDKREHQEEMMRKFHDEIFGASSQQTQPESTGNVLLDMFHSRQLVLDPQSRSRFAWDIFLMMLTIFISFELPYRLAFVEHTSSAFKVYDYFVDCVFFLDIALNFRTGYISDGEAIYDPVMIAKRYASTWFLVDFISTMQWELIVCSSTSCSDESSQDVARSLSLLRVSKVSRLLRLLRLTRLYRYLERWEGASIFLSSNTLRVFKLISLMIIFAHWDGCLHYLVAVLEGMPDNAWPKRANIYHEPKSYQYLVSLFNAVSQMLSIGYGMVGPERMADTLMVLFSMILGATLYGLFVASLTSFLADSDASAKQYASRLDMLNQYMKHRQLPAMLRVKMRRYLELCFPNKRAFNENEILYSLTLPLRQQVCWHKCAKILEKMPLHENLEPGLMGAMSLALHRVVYVQGDYILREGEIGKDMYFVAAGEVQVVTGPPDRHVEVTRLREGAFFGEMALLDNAERHMASVRVVTFCDGFCMSRQSYQALVKDYPSVREYLESVAKLRLAASLESSLGEVQERESETNLPDFAGQDLRSLVNTVKTSGFAMAPIHQGLELRKAPEKSSPFGWITGCFGGTLTSSVRDLNNLDSGERSSRCSLRKGSCILESARRRSSCLSFVLGADRRSSTKNLGRVAQQQQEQAKSNMRKAAAAANTNNRRVSVAPSAPPNSARRGSTMNGPRRASVAPGDRLSRRMSSHSRRNSSVAPTPEELAHSNALATLALCGYRVKEEAEETKDDSFDLRKSSSTTLDGTNLDGASLDDSFDNGPAVDMGLPSLYPIRSSRQFSERDLDDEGEDCSNSSRVAPPIPEQGETEEGAAPAAEGNTSS